MVLFTFTISLGWCLLRYLETASLSEVISHLLGKSISCCRTSPLSSFRWKSAITFRWPIHAGDEVQLYIKDWSVRDYFFFHGISSITEIQLLPRGKYNCIRIFVVVLLGNLNLDCSIVQPVAEKLPESDLLKPPGPPQKSPFCRIVSCLATYMAGRHLNY